MKLLTAAFLLAFATPTFAGGPVIVEEAYEAEPAPKLSPGENLAIAAGLILVIGLIAIGGGDDPVTPPPAGCKSVEC